MNPIQNVSVPIALPGRGIGPAQSAGDASGFRQMLLQSIEQVNAMQQQADKTVEALAAGEEISPAQVLTAVQKADLAFRLMMQIRNKLVQAYQEIQNIRI